MNTQHDQDIAQDDIDAMKRIKEDFFDLMERVQKYCKPADYKDGFIAMEQALDEMIMPALHEANERAGDFNTLSISGYYADWLKKLKANVRENQQAEKETNT